MSADFVHLTLRVSPEMRDRLEAVAHRLGLARSSCVEEAVERWLEVVEPVLQGVAESGERRRRYSAKSGAVVASRLAAVRLVASPNAQ